MRQLNGNICGWTLSCKLISPTVSRVQFSFTMSVLLCEVNELYVCIIYLMQQDGCASSDHNTFFIASLSSTRPQMVMSEKESNI